MGARLVFGRITSIVLVSGGWAITAVRAALDFIGYSTVTDDAVVARKLAEQLLIWIMSLPIWLPWGFATIATVCLILVSWPRQTTQDAQQKAKGDQQENLGAPEIKPDPLDAIKIDSSPTRWTVPLGDRSSSVTGIAIVASSTRIYTLSTSKSLSGNNGRVRIRIDSLMPNGNRNSEFGNNGSGYIIFSLPGDYRPAPQRITALNDNSLVITGTAFADGKNASRPFVIKINENGSFDEGFGDGGIFLIQIASEQNYGWDTIQAGDTLYTICSSLGSTDVTLVKFSTQLRPDASAESYSITISGNDTIWPSRLFWVFPETAFYILGKTRNAAHQTDGFIAKVDGLGKLDTGFGCSGAFLLKEKLQPQFINNCTGATIVNDGLCLVSGYGNEAFMIAIGAHGDSISSFAENGAYYLRGIHRTYAASVAASAHLNVIALSGMESDGNSIERAFVAFTDLRGNDLKVGVDNMERISSDAKTKMVDHIISDEAAIFGLVQEGGTSQGTQGASVVRIPIPVR